MTDRISHAFLFNYWLDEDPKPGTFKGIARSYLPSLVAGTGAKSDTAAPTQFGSGMQASASSPRDSWQPLLGAGGGAQAAAGAAGPGSAGGKFASGFGRVGTAGEGAGGRPNIDVMPSGSTSTSTSTAKTGKPRYEFVVMFIWREPTPSDDLMKRPEGGQ